VATANRSAFMRRFAFILPWLLLLTVSAVADDEDDDKPPAAAAQGLVLTSAQQQAVGIRLEQPRALSSAPQIEAYGTVLDPVALLTDADRIETAQAAAAAAGADAARLASLYHDGAQASLKSLQASQAQSIETSAQAQAAVMTFQQQWGPLANLSSAQRHTLIEALARGERALLRADVPGRHTGSVIAPRALIEVDGANVVAQVLGPLPRADAQTQSAGWLLQVDSVPQGLGPGTRVGVRLQAAALKGILVPAASLVYAADGTYVYRQVAGAKADTFQYAQVGVKPLARVGEGWLVDGLTPNDRIVVQGAGVLWSLQGISSFSAAEEDHD
jgi:hypothetical protein